MVQEGQGRMLLRHGVFAARGSNKEVDNAEKGVMCTGLVLEELRGMDPDHRSKAWTWRRGVPPEW